MRAHCLRFVGGVGWRQNEQTYDALALSSSVIAKTALTYAYVGQVRRIFGQNSAAGKMNVDTHLLNAKVTIKGFTPLPRTIDEQDEYFEFWNPEITSQDQIELIERTEYDNNNDWVRGKVIPSQIPVLMFTSDNAPHFRKDDIGKTEDMRAWAKMQLSIIYHVKNAKQIIDWETGHWPQEDKPNEVANEISDFLDKVRLTL